MQIFRLSTVPMKINQIPYVVFQTSSQFFFKYCITFSVTTELLCNFLAQHYIPWIKKSFEVQILRLFSAPLKFIQFLMSFLKPQDQGI